MKKTFLLFGLAAVLFSCGGSDNDVVIGDKTTMSVQTVFDAGTVVKGEIIKAKFKVENTGDNPLILASVSGSCTCTIADWTKDPIAPGETGEIKAEVNTKDFNGGPVTRSIKIQSNTVPNTTEVLVKANIKN